jgi:hypothetical protein
MLTEGAAAEEIQQESIRILLSSGYQGLFYLHLVSRSMMHGAIYTSSSNPQYAFMAWCSVKGQGQLYLLPFILKRSKKLKSYLSKAEIQALHMLWVNANLMVLQVDKGNAMVILNTTDWVRKILAPAGGSIMSKVGQGLHIVHGVENHAAAQECYPE